MEPEVAEFFYKWKPDGQSKGENKNGEHGGLLDRQFRPPTQSFGCLLHLLVYARNLAL